MLDGFLTEAFTANTDLAAAEANLSVARAALEATRSERYPTTTVEVGGIYGRDATTDEILELGRHRAKSTWLFDDVLDMSYEIDLFGHVRRSIEASRADAAATAAARDLVRVTVAAETTRAYAEICTLGDRLAVARHSLEVVSREASITTQRRSAGASSSFDVARAEALVAQVRAEIPPLEGQRRSALFQLTALLGRTPANAPREAEACTAPPQLDALIPVGDGRRAAQAPTRYPRGRAPPGRRDCPDRRRHIRTLPADQPGRPLWRGGDDAVGSDLRRRVDLGCRAVDQLELPQHERPDRPAA